MVTINSVNGGPAGGFPTDADSADAAGSFLAGEIPCHDDDFADPRFDIDAERSQSISSLIECQIIPRLMVAHTGHVSSAVASRISEESLDVRAFASLAITVEADVLIAHVEALIARGMTYQSVMVDFLAPAARMLGTFWEEDLCDFVDVTMALWRLQEIVHEFAGRQSAAPQPRADAHRALFAPMPGEQHTFGTIVVEDIFRRNGWRTDRVGKCDDDDLTRRARDDWFDLIGLTVSCDSHRARIAGVIAVLRQMSRNPNVCIMVGGRVFSADPGLAGEVGADGAASDAHDAPRLAGELVRQREACIHAERN